jgi:hypothetical protein
MPHATAPAGSRGDVRERPRYFPRQLITPDELTLQADYFRDRLRRHNRHLHGWGVVCGALVCVVPGDEAGTTKPWVVAVQPGYALGPNGDEIILDTACEVSVRDEGVVSGDDGLDDPWCTEVYVAEPDGPRYVAVRYREFQVRPVRAQPAGCSCDETPCEYSRYRDGYEIGILDACPDPETPGPGELGRAAGNPACPDTPSGSWVVLAQVEVADDGTITKIDNCACRRIIEPARWHRCGSTDADHPPKEKDNEEQPEQADATGTDEPRADEPAADTAPAAEPGPSRPRRPRRPRAGGTDTT